MVHPVDEVDVGDPPGLEHRRVPPGETGEGVARAVLGAVVGLDLDQAQRNQAVRGPVDQDAAEKIPGDKPGNMMSRYCCFGRDTIFTI